MTEMKAQPDTVGMSLDVAQTMTAKALQEADKVASQYRRRVLDLSDEVATLEQVLASKRTALDRARSECAVSVALVREHFSLYRDLMHLTGEEPVEPQP